MILHNSDAGAKAEVLTAVPLLLDMGHSRLGVFCPRMKSVPILIETVMTLPFQMLLVDGL